MGFAKKEGPNVTMLYIGSIACRSTVHTNFGYNLNRNSQNRIFCLKHVFRLLIPTKDPRSILYLVLSILLKNV